jgi:hypothetical protein
MPEFCSWCKIPLFPGHLSGTTAPVGQCKRIYSKENLDVLEKYFLYLYKILVEGMESMESFILTHTVK